MPLLGAVYLLAATDTVASRVIILANSKQAESVQLAEYYAAQRGIPPANILALPLPDAETITWSEFVASIYRPVQKELVRRGWIDGTVSTLSDRLGRDRFTISGHHISFLVTCRGVPLRIAEDVSLLDQPTGRRIGRALYRDAAAVDSELSLLARSGYEITGTLPNPFFGEENVSNLDAQSVVKVSRLDGPSFSDARQLVASALEAERVGLAGRAYVDLEGPHPDGDRWLVAVEKQIEELGFDGEAERTTATFGAGARFDAPVFYFGWYANDLNGPFVADGFRFPPGAIAMHLHSFSARSMHSTDDGWCGPMVARGVTATVGNVFEPYVQLSPRPDLLLRALSAGKYFGDAAYYAFPVLSWQSIAIGDPLYRPFKVSLEQQELHPEQLPSALAPYVKMRRANLLLRQGKTEEAWSLLRSALRDNPGLVLALACARLAVSANAVPAAVEALNLVDPKKDFSPAEWSLAHEAAILLAAHGARPAALGVYVRLVKTKAPSAAGQKSLLIEARSVAEAAGDQNLVQEFVSQLEALAPASPAK